MYLITRSLFISMDQKVFPLSSEHIIGLVRRIVIVTIYGKIKDKVQVKFFIFFFGGKKDRKFSAINY